VIIRVFRPTIHPARSASSKRDHPDEEHLLRDTWIGRYEVLLTPA
jgi:hypothetical protein